MKAALNPKLIAPSLLVGILVLLGVTVLAALWPDARHSPSQVVAARNRADAAGVVSGRSAEPRDASGRPSEGHERSAAAPVLSTITYTVGPGDTGSGIARWFRQHGYAALFAINKEIFAAGRRDLSPGSRVTIRNGEMTIANPPFMTSYEGG